VPCFSDAFQNQASFQASQLGAPPAWAKEKCVFVKHPISDQSKAQLTAKANDASKHIQQAGAFAF